MCALCVSLSHTLAPTRQHTPTPTTHTHPTKKTQKADDPALGCPVEYISLKGTSYDNPAVCKYTGNKYYSDDWKYAH